ncbi:MAG: hypothetical protein KAX58_05495 [Aeromonadaceae bacterium]|nr:hypothetical protein [Aeromonadaceae bacterium]
MLIILKDINKKRGWIVLGPDLCITAINYGGWLALTSASGCVRMSHLT